MAYSRLIKIKEITSDSPEIYFRKGTTRSIKCSQIKENSVLWTISVNEKNKQKINKIQEIIKLYNYCRLTRNNFLVSEMCCLIKFAKMYKSECLAERCNFTLHRMLNIENTPEILVHVTKYFQPILNSLKQRVFKIFRENTNECLESDYLLQVDENTMIELFNLEEYNCESEITLLNYAVQWDRYKFDKLRKWSFIRNKVLPYIRLLTLTESQFKACSKIKWLTHKEQKSVLKSIINQQIQSDYPDFLSKSFINRCTYR